MIAPRLGAARPEVLVGPRTGGDSAIVSPDGQFIAGPARKQAAILYAEIDPRQLRGPKWMLDVAGHYARPDVFQLSVRTNARPLVVVQEDAAIEPYEL